MVTCTLPYCLTSLEYIEGLNTIFPANKKPTPMSATLFIIIGLAGFALLLFAIAQSGRTSRPEVRQRPQQPQAIPPGYIPYLMPPQPEEAPEPGDGFSRSLLFLGILGVAALALYIAYKPAGVEKDSKPLVPDKEQEFIDTSNQDSNGFYYYDVSTGRYYYYDIREKKSWPAADRKKPEQSYAAPLPSPGIKRQEPVTSYDNTGNSLPTIKGYTDLDYSRGYAVQLCARENDWLEAPELGGLQQSLKGQHMLISKGYNQKGAAVTKYLIGPFESRKEADDFALQAGRKFEGAFSLPLSSLKQVERYWPRP